ncbi:histidinol dehydrogenase [Buchnera aphidicola (Thelaxes californica)]|uniref:Histidinol dehydrogenase n=1 Tax=Buchnera aphidicola (Thelaxes californica) TaxID=1315998 RepID=A0A4D6YLU0_9GAMM|nr:histidinol dehydrogenase [Buchnera aphidicola]QCI26638.1 histidinol dehydrogenase [Buchnera aphidicola (Thelaxes californica)]
MNICKNIYYWSNLNAQDKKQILSRPAVTNKKQIAKDVENIIHTVKKERNQALYKYSKLFDNFTIKDIKKKNIDIINSKNLVSQEFKKAVQIAKKNIFKFHNLQKLHEIDIEIQPGIRCQKLIRPIESVGLYIPGGTAPLISTVLMLAIPAMIAQCKNIVLCSPPKISNEILYSAYSCGIETIYEIGGAQAIAALAFGTESINKVDKIFGPGNAYVTEAKLQVSKIINGPSIDMLAGPSELLIIADETSRADFIALDMLSQSEHGYDSQIILVTSSINIAEEVIIHIKNFLKNSDRIDCINSSLNNSKIIITNDIMECIFISNLYAPEHLIIQTKNPRSLLKNIINAGSIFLGLWSPESAGDYASGTNHVLPTYGSARSISGLGVSDFQKSMTVQELTCSGLSNIAHTIEILAESEQLIAHKNAVSFRLSTIMDNLNDV